MTMPAPFAALQARLNSAVFLHLSSAVAALDGIEVQGMFHSPYQLADMSGVGMASSLPAFTLPTASVPDDWEGKPLVITRGMGVGNYTVRGHMPDGLGISVLSLEIAA